MSVPTFIQSKTAANDAAASTTHAITLDNAILGASGARSPRTLILQISYDGNTGSLVSGITDTLGNTWQRCTDGTTALTFSNGAGVNGEMWYAYNLAGGAAPTITVTTTSSVKSKIAVAEMDQVRPVSPIDRTNGQVDTVNSTTRSARAVTGGGAYTDKCQGQIGVYIGGIAWNNTRTISAGGSTWTGTGSQVVSLSGGSSNLGVGIERKNTSSEQQITSATNHVARFVMSGVANTDPAAVMTCAFYRDGVVTSTDEDGTTQNIEGVAVAYSANIAASSPWGFCPTYMSSTSAPNGGTGASETDHSYFFYPDYSSYLLPGVTIGNSITWKIKNAGAGFDDGTGNTTEAIYFYKNGTFGTTLDASDDNIPGNYLFYGNYFIDSFGLWQTLTVDKSYFNTAGYTTAAVQMQGDTMGTSSSTWGSIADYSMNSPSYLVLDLNYPASSTPLRTLMGAGT